MAQFQISEGHKFALLAVINVYTDLGDDEFRLSDGIWVLKKLPVQFDGFWKKQIGASQLDRLQSAANFVLARTAKSDHPEILDAEHERLANQLSRLFYLIQLSGVLEYERAKIIKGSWLGGEGSIREIDEHPHFYQTKGYSRKPLTKHRLERATGFIPGLADLESSPEKRTVRGLNTLIQGLQSSHSQDRLHHFVKSLEALVLPEAGKTRRQFVHRSQTFAKPGEEAKTILGEAFDMRSAEEHLHDWQSALQGYPASEREDVAFQRTRQMELLASFAYSQILEHQNIRPHFKTDGACARFWKLENAERRTVWGNSLDLSSIACVKDYDSWGRS